MLRIFYRTIVLTAVITVALIVTACSAEKQTVHPHVLIDTKFGSMEIELLPEIAPNHVNNFLKLARSGFYNGTLFHRVIPGFMIQGGDPNTKGKDKSKYGQGGPGYTIDAEFNDQPHVRGTLSMARAADPNSAGSQFFIVLADARYLDHQYTVFGRIVKGMDVADMIAAQPRDGNDLPLQRIEMKVREIKATSN